ncbi:hypothetical protein LK996_12175 [Lysobacter sp. A6]|uniref:Secreted protein n=1 Tax=Noviluteimonas lactosilytica TaxID=2888523 RepID=A0ABS8JJP2_9GAMM|nr:hypothetical protein [Lysobacter lactosilyticus]MCC8363830.1 hypothetical protein [Lysobacter lactosilyticus]
MALVAMQLGACASASDRANEGEFVQRRTTFPSGVVLLIVASEPRFTDDICWANSRTSFVKPGKDADESAPEPDEITLFPGVDASNCSRSGVAGRNGIRATKPALSKASASYRIIDALLRPSRPLAPLCLDARGIGGDIETSTFYVTDMYGTADDDDVAFELMSDEHASVSFSVDATNKESGWALGQVTCSVDWTM